MKTEQVDLLVIGAGPAGQKGAIQGAKGGLKVVVADRLGLLGGACLNQSTVPSKALRQAILDMTGFIQSGQGTMEARDPSTKYPSTNSGHG